MKKTVQNFYFHLSLLAALFFLTTGCSGSSATSSENQTGGGLKSSGKGVVFTGAVKPIRGVVLGSSSLTLILEGDTGQLSATVLFRQGEPATDVVDDFMLPDGNNKMTVVWSSDDPGVATVDAHGTVTAVGAGNTFVHVRVDEAGGQETLARVFVAPSSLSESNPENPEIVPPPSKNAPYIDTVVSYDIGEYGGLNAPDLMHPENPNVLLGGPKGEGVYNGSKDTFSLGKGGEVIVKFTDYIVADGEGVDFTVFENPFLISGDPLYPYAEPGIVGVSDDGVHFVDFPCDDETRPYTGCAGVHPVFANVSPPAEGGNQIDPTDPAVSGGDSFDLATVGMKTARYIRIRDSGILHPPIGDGNAGFDLDAIAIVNGTLP
jgi:hypothetical protein